MIQNNQNKKQPYERLLDPSEDAQDIVGDTNGMTGITSGNPINISAEPSDDVTNLDLEQQPGTAQNVKKTPEGSLEVSKENNSEKIYNKKIHQGMSSTYVTTSNATASDTSEQTSEQPGTSQLDITQEGAQTVSTDENALGGSSSLPTIQTDPFIKDQGQIATQISPDEAGEQSVSGDMPSPDSDDDVLSNAQAVGTQTHEDPENPEEVDIGRDIDEAEEYHKEH